MHSGVYLGKIFGIRLRIDYSWLLIFVLTSWNLSSSLGTLHQDWHVVLRWALGILGALLYFGSVLAHELAHSLVAKFRGIPVRGIKLHLFGGIANIQEEPKSPGDEFLMALVGPLTSFAIGGAMLIIFALNMATAFPTTNVTRMLAELGPWDSIFLWVGSANMIVGLFNLIPGFPLDGGRLLRSVFWAVSGNLKRATKWASWVGQVFAWLMIISGIAMTFGARLPFFGTGVVSGLWLAFIGWFLHNSAVQSYQQLVIRDILEDVAVADIMRPDPPRVAPSCSVGTLVHSHMMQSDDYAFPVIDNEALVGLVTLDDVRSVGREQWQETLVSDIMTPVDKLITIAPEDDAREALDRLSQQDVRQLPVLAEGKLTGLLRRRDIVKWLQLQSGFSTPSRISA